MMAQIWAYIALVLFMIGIMILIIKRNGRLDIEKDKQPLHIENCGGFFGLFNYPLILVRFAIYDDFLVISYARKILLPFADIDKVEIEKRRFNYGVQIVHQRKDIPKYIFIWSRYGDVLKESLGAKVNDRKDVGAD